MKVTLILACAGKGKRAEQGKNKLLTPVDGVTCLERTLNAFLKCDINDIIVTASNDDFNQIVELVDNKAKVVIGGATRSQSVKNALAVIDDGIVLIHDGARPFVSTRVINDCIDSVIKYGSAITVYPSRDTILSAKEDFITDYLGKDGLYSVQTPQAFFVKDIKKAYELAGEQVFNDDGEIYSRYVGTPRVVLGSSDNIKITYPEDMLLLAKDKTPRFGVGFDCHKLVENRKLILGGIEIPHDKGLLGHSDADVLTHAIMDAMLSALSLRDIGYHFSDKDPRYKDANSMKLLDKVIEMITDQGYKVDSISATIMAEKPKLLNHIPSITKNLSLALDIPLDKVGIGATTLEGLGFVGREKGICVHATAVLTKI